MVARRDYGLLGDDGKLAVERGLSNASSWPPETQTILQYHWEGVLFPYWTDLGHTLRGRASAGRHRATREPARVERADGAGGYATGWCDRRCQSGPQPHDVDERRSVAGSARRGRLPCPRQGHVCHLIE